jgi:DNA-binding beta-propeller fold protein YncE
MKRLCLLSAGENKLTFYDTNLKKEHEYNVKGIKNAGPRKMVYAEGYLYTANSYDGSVSKIDVTSGSETAAEICVYPTGIVYIPHSGYLAVSCGETDRLIILDKKLHIIEGVGCKSFPLNLALSADGRRLLTACLSVRKVKVYDSTSFILKTELELEGYPYFALEDSRGHMYIAYSKESYFVEGKICAYDSARKKYAEGETGKMPTTICFAEREGRLFVANTGNKSVDIFNKDTLEKIGSIAADYMPDDILCHEGAVYITCMLENTLIKTDMNGKIIKRIITRDEPRGLLLID